MNILKQEIKKTSRLKIKIIFLFSKVNLGLELSAKSTNESQSNGDLCMLENNH